MESILCINSPLMFQSLPCCVPIISLSSATFLFFFFFFSFFFFSNDDINPLKCWLSRCYRWAIFIRPISGTSTSCHVTVVPPTIGSCRITGPPAIAYAKVKTIHWNWRQIQKTKVKFIYKLSKVSLIFFFFFFFFFWVLCCNVVIIPLFHHFTISLFWTCHVGPTGQQFRKPVCVQVLGQQKMPEEYCSASPPPQAQTQPCQTQCILRLIFFTFLFNCFIFVIYYYVIIQWTWLASTNRIE